MADLFDRMRAESDWLKAELTLRAEIERLRNERDEARRMACEKEAWLRRENGSARDHAKQRGWDCYKENS